MKLNDYIIEHADLGLHANDLLAQFAHEEVFFAITPPGTLAANLAPQLTPLSNVPLVHLGGGRLALFYVSRDDPELPDQFSGMPLGRAMQVIFEHPAVSGMLLQSNSDAWLQVPKAALQQMMLQGQ